MTEAQMNNANSNAEDTTMKNEQTTTSNQTDTSDESSSWGWKAWTGIAVAAVALVGVGYWGYSEFFSGSSESSDSVIG